MPEMNYGFNLRIEILIVDSRAENAGATGYWTPVSISELRFLSLIDKTGTAPTAPTNMFQSQN